jgi:asparagine synthase (glutamine-hydrolysing)
MSGIAGIVRFDGAPLEPNLIAKMTAAMEHRGPDAITHWQSSDVSLGHCMFRTTPESLAEHQPHTNEDKSLVLVMDGRVDNCDELRRNLLAEGAILRDQTDTELVMRAYETWGKRCPERIIGELAFFIWDQRQRCLFGARDAVGTRHFYYHEGANWFGFASEIKGLLATGQIESRLNESRVFDYLVPEFDRDDQIGTFYQGIVRLPAGHAMLVSTSGVKTWRYWDPGNLESLKCSSLGECAEAFLDQLRVAVKCRLRSIGPVGAMLSGGLDSSSIVGLIRKEFQGELREPLKTFSLIREDRENCKDWQHIEEVLKDGWVDPAVITTESAGLFCQPWLDSIAGTDEPFALSHGLTYAMIYQAAQQRGCRVVMDGMAGDVLFYSVSRSLDLIVKRGMLKLIPEIFDSYARHGIEGAERDFCLRVVAAITPASLRSRYRRLRQRHASRNAGLELLQPCKSGPWLSERLLQRQKVETILRRGTDQAEHAACFTSGLLSFGHETYGQLAFANGVEPRSPFSDRRVVELAVRMPVQMKLGAPWYKYLLRKVATNVLPESVVWRSDLGNHPGWKAYERLIRELEVTSGAILSPKCDDALLIKLLDHKGFHQVFERYVKDKSYESGYLFYVLTMLNCWLAAHPRLI